MDVSEALARRRMTRSFSAQPIDGELLVRLARDALRSPTAGNARGIELLVLSGPDEVAQYFATTTDVAWRQRSARFAGLARASGVIVVLADPHTYVERYGAEDKAASGLGEDLSAWPVPYWIGDAGAATMSLLLSAESLGLGCCFLGAFRGTEDLVARFDIPDRFVVYGAILIGHPDGRDHRSASLDRAGPSRANRVHRGRFGSAGQA